MTTRSTLVLAAGLFCLPAVSLADLVLSEKILHLSKTGAELSALAYDESPANPGYDSLQLFDDEPDQALVVEADGYCWAAFRGTTLTFDDWKQNIKLGDHDVDITTDDPNEQQTCSVRIGFWDAYATVYKDDLETTIRDCATKCLNPDECVIFTGHSQGGAVAAVAAIAMADLNPYVFTYGQPATIREPCPFITSDRWYRFVNTKDSELYSFGISYDPVPFAPGMGASNWGHMILLSGDVSGVAYIGLDVQDYFGPLNVNGFEAHSIVAVNGSEYPGYLERIDALIEAYDHFNYTYPVRNNGYTPGSLCTQGKECESGTCDKETGFSWKRCVGVECTADKDCPETGRCDSGVCAPKLGSCAKCDEDSDCLYGSCSWSFRCSGPGGLFDNECFCNLNSDCISGRCEGAILTTHRICEAQLAVGAHCNEASDCLSGACSWQFKCVDPAHSNPLEDIATMPPVLVKEDSAIGMILVAAMAAIVGITVVAYMYCKRRRGYQEIPATLNV